MFVAYRSCLRSTMLHASGYHYTRSMDDKRHSQSKVESSLATRIYINASARKPPKEEQRLETREKVEIENRNLGKFTPRFPGVQMRCGAVRYIFQAAPDTSLIYKGTSHLQIPSRT